MNKLRLIKIYELQGKVHPIEEYLIGILDGIVEVKFGKYIKYKKDGIEYFFYNNENNDIITSVKFDFLFDEMFNLSSSSYERNEIIRYLLEKHLNLKINNVN